MVDSQVETVLDEVDEPDDRVAELIRGAVDLHIHTAPDVLPRCVTAMSAAVQAREARMAAIVVKSHVTDTAARAEQATEVSGMQVFGGVALNYPVGGLNPHAVTATAAQGGRVVWMPTVGARHFIRHAALSPTLGAITPRGVAGLAVLSKGRLTSSALRVLDAVAQHRLVLASGHLSPEETVVLFEAARERGIDKLVVTHPQAPFVGMDLPTMRSLAHAGAFLEFTPQLSVAERAELIRAVGVEHCVLSTDGGTARAAPPRQRMADYVRGLLENGFAPAEISYLVRAAPAYLAGLPGHDERPRLAKGPPVEQAGR